jgi:DNA-binding NarL/FixJ family response regulator
VRDLKERLGTDLHVMGSSALIRSLMPDGLIDEYVLMPPRCILEADEQPVSLVRSHLRYGDLSTSEAGTSVERVADAVQRARAAARRRSWAEARSVLQSLDQASLVAEDIELMADCEWWLCHLDESITTRQRAYQAYVASGDHPRAAYNAWFVAYDYFSKGEGSIGAGWLARAQRHLATHPECLEHAYLAIAEAHSAEGEGNWEDACGFSRRALLIAEKFGNRDVATVALQTLGRELIALGDVPQGVGLLDEAMTSVVGGELGDFCTGWVYCGALIACLEVGEVGRAADWSDAAQKWCDSLAASTPYNGLCRTYKVAVLSLRGNYVEAERDARRATAELAAFVPQAVSAAWYEIGEIRRRLGDLTAAEEAFTRAHEMGADPQPGLALVRLAQGRLDAAAAGLRTSLSSTVGNRLARTRLLAAQLQVALAQKDLSAAEVAKAELLSIAADYGSSFVRAHAEMAAGLVALAHDDHAQALDRLQRAWREWSTLRLPYEGALTRLLLAEAARAAGDDERAKLEMRAARDALRQTGASLEIHGLINVVVGRRPLPGGLSRREAQVLSLVASGKTNRQIGAELVISEHTVARHVSNILTKLDLSSRAAATAFAVENGLVPSTLDSQN